jgi:hypothetical protein
MTAVDGANFFLQIMNELLGIQNIQPTTYYHSAADFAGWLKAKVDEFLIKM